MSCSRSFVFAFPALIAALAPSLCAAQPPQSPQPPAVLPAKLNIAIHRKNTETLKHTADWLSATTGARVLTDSVLGPQLITPPDATGVTAETLEVYLTRLALRLPPGSAWFKIYLPAAESRGYRPDRIADMARAQADLFGRPTPGMIQIQGRSLSPTDAKPVLQTLGLEPVYILTSRLAPRPGTMAALGGVDTSQMMDSLTKQLGVGSVADIPTGNYKVSLPGPDGVMRDATVEVENTEGKRRISVRVGDGVGTGTGK